MYLTTLTPQSQVSEEAMVVLVEKLGTDVRGAPL